VSALLETLGIGDKMCPKCPHKGYADHTYTTVTIDAAPRVLVACKRCDCRW
jgi:hypothetical protein